MPRGRPPMLRDVNTSAAANNLEITQTLQAKTNLDRGQAKDAVEIFLMSIKDALINGERASLVGFGTFYTKTRLGRIGHNPKTGKPIDIPEKRAVVFKPGKGFRERIDGLEKKAD
jgi:DNA-binding protein HU-beta